MMFEESEYYSPSEVVFNCIDSPMSSSKKQKMINKRRFSDEQVKSLELIFEKESKLEPKKKVQVARELGLHPHQVAIWFQNKRARYKSKQLEHDYTILRDNYNALTTQSDSLNKQKQTLVLQVQELREMARKADEEEGTNNEVGISESENYGDKLEESDISNRNKLKVDDDHQSDNEAKPSDLSMETTSILSDDDGSSDNIKYLETNEMDVLKIVDPAAADSLAAQPTWVDHDLRPDGLFNQAVDGCQWWDFWSAI